MGAGSDCCSVKPSPSLKATISRVWIPSVILSNSCCRRSSDLISTWDCIRMSTAWLKSFFAASRCPALSLAWPDWRSNGRGGRTCGLLLNGGRKRLLSRYCFPGVLGFTGTHQQNSGGQASKNYALKARFHKSVYALHHTFI